MAASVDPSAAPASRRPAAPRPVLGGLFDRFSDRQMNLGIILLGLLLYVPLAGTYGLSDPWETHYGEVARQMAVRHDYISLWWPGAPIDADHFWSKPVLSFWIMSIFLRLFGVAGGAPGAIALGTRAEWALRLPFCLMGVLGIWGLYLCVSRFAGRRAGVLSALILATSPLYFLVARQAMTDMAFVGPMTMALALGFLALFEDDEGELPRRTWRGLSWPHHPLAYLSAALFVVSTLPQLIVNCIQLAWPIRIGSHHVNIPGVLVMAPYLLGFVGVLRWSARLRRKAPLYLLLAAVLCGLAMLAKGLAGLGLPVLVFLIYLGFTWNWKRLQRPELGIGVLLAFVACAVVAVPWHHAMLVRHGFPFWDELYGDNHWRRLVTGRHGDRGTFEYFLRELGYGFLPWIGLAPAALATAAMRPVRGETRQALFWFGAIWFVAAYTLVSLSVTKFHHYVLPAVPGLAIIVGLTIDDFLSRRASRVAAVTAILGVGVWAVVTADLVAAKNAAQRFIWLFSYDYINAPKGRPWPEALDFRGALLAFGAAFALAGVLLCWRRARRGGAVALSLLAVAFTYYLLDRYMPATAAYWSQKHLIATYYQTRRSPSERLLVWQMYWRGENFYTANEIYEGPKDERTVFLGDKNVENLKTWVEHHRGRRAFLLVERSRYGQVPGMFPPETRQSLHVIDESNMKFLLAQIDL
jgi:4-amino-4-deoxy-L-arabinose transferase-like glycosyltransferase